MATWPLIKRNKVEDSKVSVPVEACAASEDPDLSALAQQVRVRVADGAVTHTKVTRHVVARTVVEP